MVGLLSFQAQCQTMKVRVADRFQDELPPSGFNRGVIESKNISSKKMGCGLIGKVLDKKTRLPIPQVTIVLLDNKSGEVKTLVTNYSGEFEANYKFSRKIIDFDLTISKDGYLVKKINFKKVITKPGTIRMEEELGPLEIGYNIAGLCGIFNILYDFDKSSISMDASLELDKLVKCMNENPEIIIEIGSHTDCRGLNKYNEKLSDRRAKSARKYVVSHGIEPYRVFGKGYGETRLINNDTCKPTIKSECTKEKHKLNRTTEFIIVSGGNGVKNNGIIVYK